MKYQYSVFHFGNDVFIVESSEVAKNEWSIGRLKKNIENISKLDRPSYIRTKEWVEENKPELLL
jgi:hypothetical protein